MYEEENAGTLTYFVACVCPKFHSIFYDNTLERIIQCITPSAYSIFKYYSYKVDINVLHILKKYLLNYWFCPKINVIITEFRKGLVNVTMKAFLLLKFMSFRTNMIYNKTSEK